MKKYLLLPVALFSVTILFAQSSSPASQPIRLIDKHFNLGGTLSGASVQSFIGLEADDKIVINGTRLSKKGSAIITVKDYNKGAELYKKDFDTLREQTIAIPAKGIYVVELKSG